MSCTGWDTVKADSAKWSWGLFCQRRRRFLTVLGALSLILLLLLSVSLLLRVREERRLLHFRLSSPLSPLQHDHPLNYARAGPSSSTGFAAAGQREGHKARPTTALALLRGGDASSPSVPPKTSSFQADVAPTSPETPGQKSQRFFRAATAAATRGGVVLPWGEATIRLLRGAEVGEAFFLFYDPQAAGTFSERQDASQQLLPDPLKVFRDLAYEDSTEQRQEQQQQEQQQQQQLLPFVAVPRSDIYRLSFFLPEYTENSLPLALIVRLDSGWLKYEAPAGAAYSVSSLRAFLQSYRRGEAAPLLRTEALPATPPLDGIRQLVASSFSRSVLEQTDYDALVFLYANWCGHCRRFHKRLQGLANQFEGIRSVAFFKMDVSRNDVPVPGLRVERVPHVVFFARDPDESTKGQETASALQLAGSKEETRLRAEATSRAAAAAAASQARDTGSSQWFVGTAASRKRVVFFSHSEPDVLAYGEAFLLEHAFCKSIDLDQHVDCNSSADLKAVEL